jgi:hypothetical protein
LIEISDYENTFFHRANDGDVKYVSAAFSLITTLGLFTAQEALTKKRIEFEFEISSVSCNSFSEKIKYSLES